MNPILRRVLAIAALVLFIPFLVFFIMALGAFQVAGNLAPILASVFGLAILIVFLLLKMDDIKRRRMSEAEEIILKEHLGVDGEEEDAAETDATDESDESAAQEESEGAEEGADFVQPEQKEENV